MKQIARSVSNILIAGTLVIFAARLLQYFQSAFDGRLEITAALLATVLRLPEFLYLFLPLAWLAGNYITLANMWANNELYTAIFSAADERRIVATLLAAGTLCGLITASLSIWVIPTANQQAEQVLLESKARSAFLFLEAGRFHSLGNGWQINIGYKQGDDFLLPVFVKTRRGNGVEILQGSQMHLELCDNSVLSACTPQLNWPSGAVHTQFSASGALQNQFNSTQMSIPLQVSKPSGSRPQSYPTDTDSLNIWLQWHFATPLMCLIGLLLVWPAAKVAPRQRALSWLPIILPLILFYTGTIVHFYSELRQLTQPARFAGIWGAHGFFLALALFILIARHINTRRFLKPGLLGAPKAQTRPTDTNSEQR
ncbi:MAG: LptF/LptG family permease [Gammaproteobacteria bacterium]